MYYCLLANCTKTIEEKLPIKYSSHSFLSINTHYIYYTSLLNASLSVCLFLGLSLIKPFGKQAIIAMLLVILFKPSSTVKVYQESLQVTTAGQVSIKQLDNQVNLKGFTRKVARRMSCSSKFSCLIKGALDNDHMCSRKRFINQLRRDRTRFGLQNLLS